LRDFSDEARIISDDDGDSFSGSPGRIGFLVRLLEALHHSRRLQARNFIWAHRHLFAESCSSADNPAHETTTASTAERSSSTRRFLRIPAPSANVLLAIVAFAFLALHVLAGTLVHPYCLARLFSLELSFRVLLALPSQRWPAAFSCTLLPMCIGVQATNL